MGRISYTGLPPEGAKNERDVARTVNQMLAGFQNNVFDFTVPVGTIDQPGEIFRVNDLRISQQKYINFLPLNTAAEIADVFINNIGNGFFDITSLPAELLFAQVQVSQDAGAIGSLVGSPIIPFDTTDINTNFTVDLVNNRIVSNIIGTVQVAFSISGNYATGTLYEFGVRLFDNITDQNEIGSFAVATSTSNQNSLVAVSAVLFSQVVPGNYFEAFGFSLVGGVFDPYDLRLNVMTTSPNRGTPVLDELQYRCLVIG